MSEPTPSIEPATLQGSLEIQKLNNVEGNLTVANLMTAERYANIRETKTFTGDGMTKRFKVYHSLPSHTDLPNASPFVNVTIYDDQGICFVPCVPNNNNVEFIFDVAPPDGRSFFVALS